MDDAILIPPNVSIYGCYSSGYILGASTIAGLYQYYITAILGGLLSITSYFNWKNVMKYNWIKNVDIMLACLMILYISLVDSASFHPTYRRIWFATVCFMVAVFTVNEVLLYYQVKKPVYINKESIFTSPYFSTNYTYPGTPQRAYAYYRSTWTHIMFIHLLPVSVLLYCIYKSQ